MNLATEYRRLCVAPSDIQLHLPRVVALTQGLDAQHVIELGVRSGVSTVAWLYALEQTGGQLTSVDVDEAPDLGDQPHWTFIRGNDLDPAVLARMRPADIVFIDTIHTYDHTVAELEAYYPLVRPGGRVVLHDTMLRQPEGQPEGPPYPVRTAVEGFCRLHNLAWEEHRECWGLAVITVGGI